MREPEPSFSESERLQQRQYDRLADDYAAHASDPCTLRYRERFIDGPLFVGADLRGKKVLEAMCGHGGTTRCLLDHGADVTGLDISRSALRKFSESWPQCAAIAESILRTSIPGAHFDCVVAVGGLHHLHPHVDQAIDEIHRILKPGGLFCFTDPHAASVFEGMRRLWYRLDSMFAANEAGIDIPGLMARNADRFEFIKTEYLGSLAYLLVLNSLVFRMPSVIKRVYSPALVGLEGWLNPVLGPRTAMYVVCQWRKRQVYQSDRINRLDVARLRAIFESSPFRIEWMEPIRDDEADEKPGLAGCLATLLGRSADELMTLGYSILLRKA